MCGSSSVLILTHICGSSDLRRLNVFPNVVVNKLCADRHFPDQMRLTDLPKKGSRVTVVNLAIRMTCIKVFNTNAYVTTITPPAFFRTDGF